MFPPCPAAFLDTPVTATRFTARNTAAASLILLIATILTSILHRIDESLTHDNCARPAPIRKDAREWAPPGWVSRLRVRRSPGTQCLTDAGEPLLVPGDREVGL